MKNDIVMQIVDVHAEGEGGRVILNGGDFVKGDTMAERFQYCEENLLPLRNLALREPRGNPAMCGVFVLPPVNEGSDFGIVVLEHGGFTPMSGSNTICTVTAMIETGQVKAVEPITEVKIDTAVGTITVEAEVKDGKVKRVNIFNVPTFVVGLDIPVDVPEYGVIPVDVVFGGQFFAQTDVANFGLTLDPNNGKELARAGAMLRIAANEQVKVAHPTNPGINTINLVMLHSGTPAEGKINRNTVCMALGKIDKNDPRTWTGALDRSPCGTGTSGRMTALHARGQLALNTPFHHRSIIDSEFIGELLGETKVGDKDAVLPKISGRAWVIGRGELYLNSEDPFREGFTIADIWAPTDDK